MPTDYLEVNFLAQGVAFPEVPENEAKQVFDAAIAGQLIVPMVDADYTLKDTNTNGSLTYPYEWHHGILLTSTANTATRTLTIPAGKKNKYIIHNTSGFDIILSQGGVEYLEP